MQPNTETVLLHLNLIDGLGPAVAKRLLAHISPDELSHIYTFTERDFKERCLVTDYVAKKLCEGLQDIATLEREVALLKEHNIAWMSFLHPKFPPLLKEIHLPPIGLYVRGTVPTTTAVLAVVGSRDANKYAQRVIDRIIPELCAQGTVIVSGGARGVDTMAHEAAVACQLPTIAVMGCGLLKISRYENIALFPHVVRTGGAIVSSFPLTMQAAPEHFPARNRIISGLSRGCLVVQAAKKSGALITANYALEQGREVFAVPGPIDDLLSAGCNNLLRQGATLVESAQDIFDVLPIFTTKPMQLSIDTNDQMEHIESGLEVQSVNGDSVNNKLVALCAKPVSVDELANKLSLELFDVQSRLFDLQMVGRVQQNFAGLWHL